MIARALLVLALALALPAAAHEAHGPAEAPPPAFPLDIRPAFALTDHHGRIVTEADLAGRPALVFFGYAGCRAVCPLALSLMEEALQSLGPAGRGIPALLITVDPLRDTPEAMAGALAAHPRITGLTGSDAALAAARAAFGVEAEATGQGPDGPLWQHGSLIYVLGPDGRVEAMLPPVLTPDRIAAVLARLT